MQETASLSTRLRNRSIPVAVQEQDTRSNGLFTQYKVHQGFIIELTDFLLGPFLKQR